MIKKRILVILGLICGLIIVADMFLSIPWLDEIGHILLEGTIIIGGMAVLAGVINLLYHNAERLEEKSSRPGAIITLICLLGTFVMGVLPNASTRLWTYEYVLIPLQSTFTAILIFYVMETAFLHFHTKGIEAALMLGTCLVLLFIQLPISASISPIFVSLRQWLYASPIAYGARGILIGTAIGVATSSIRLLAGKNTIAEAEE